MPKIVPQYLKTPLTVQQQPKRITPRIYNIVLLDIAGKSNAYIAEATGLCESRVSQIKGAPLYKESFMIEREKLSKEVIEKQSNKIVNNPVEQGLKDLALEAVKEYGALLEKGQSEFVRKSVADQVLDRTGHKAQVEKTKISVEVTEKMASGFERALRYEPSKDARVAKIRITEEMST